jgi:uncharacterized protein
MLFGAGICLMRCRVEAAGRRPAALHYRRMGWLVLFGLSHAYLLWSGDILYDYGVCGLVVYFFRRLRPRTLVVLGLLSFAVAPLILSAYGRAAAQWPPGQLRAAREQLWQPTPAMVSREVTAYRGGWRAQMSARAPDALATQTVFFTMFSFWREVGLMLMGMALFKLGVFSASRPARLYWTMIAVALLAGVPVVLYGTYRDFAASWDFRYSLFYGMQFNYWASLLVSLGWVGKHIPIQE